VIFFANLKTVFSYTMAIARGGAFMRHLRNFFLLVVTTVLLASCNVYQVLPRADLNISAIGGGGTTLSDIQIGVIIEEDETTGAITRSYVIPSMAIQASARPGSIGVNLADYSLEYFNPNGNRIETASTTSRGTLNLNVRPGILCRTTPITECTINSPDSYTAQSAVVQSTSFSAMDGDILSALVALPNDADGSYALITVGGVDSNGNPYSFQLEPVRVIFRVTQ
jgi:hypothetical protein